MESLVALILDGVGGARRLDREALRRWTPQDGALWIQLDPSNHEARQWLSEESGLPPGDRETLLRSVSQTRVEAVDGSILLASLRAYAPDTGDVREARWYARADRLITVSSHVFPAIVASVARLEGGQGPSSIEEVIVTGMRIANESDRVATARLDQIAAELEIAAARNLAGAFNGLREARERAAALRRRLGAGREALVQLKQSGLAWLIGPHPDLWRDAASSNTELIATVDGVLDHLRGLQDYAQNRLSNALGERLYRLTVLSAIMMPLSLVTGLLGVNVGGIPASGSPWAFAGVCALLVGLAVGEYVLLRRLHWMPSAVGEAPEVLLKAADRSGRSRTEAQ